VAGDLLVAMYEDWRMEEPRPSMRSALKRYRAWSVGRRYGDGEALKYSDMQLRRYFAEAAPAAHLWAASRLLQAHKDGGKAFRAAFTRNGMPYLLGLARELQEFGATFIPKGTKPPKPVLARRDLLLIPDEIAPVKPKLTPL
jgi:hypothetical protein